MKTLNVFAIAALLTTGVLLADVAAADTTTKTRAQVVAELVQARNSGELARMNSEDTALFQQKGNSFSTKTRAQVVAELKQAQESGELASYNTDDTITALSTPRPAAAKQRAIASAE